MLRYYLSVLRFGWGTYWARIHGGWRTVILFLMQSAALFAILYFVPIMGNLQDEARLAAASAGSVLLVGLLTLLVEVAMAPVRMDQRASERLKEAHKMLRLNDDIEATKQSLLGLCQEGRAMLANTQFEAEDVRDWKGRCLPILRAHYDTNHVYEFEHETRFHYAPNTIFARMEGLVRTLEDIALSWGSVAEMARSRFYPQGDVDG